MLLDLLLFGPWSLLILLPGLVLGIYAQIKVSSTYSKYSKIRSKLGISGAMAAREMLNKSDIYDVSIRAIDGNLTDNYNPQTDVVSLSKSTHDNTSVAAIGVAAHEIGHVMQQKSNYFPIKLRSALVPVVNFGSRAFLPIFIVGILLESIAATSSEISGFLINLSIILYGLSTLFALVTLPVELNASRRAKRCLVDYGILDSEECKMAGKVLHAAALTYVASFFTSLLYFLRFVIIASSYRRRK